MVEDRLSMGIVKNGVNLDKLAKGLFKVYQEAIEDNSHCDLSILNTNSW